MKDLVVLKLGRSARREEATMSSQNVFRMNYLAVVAAYVATLVAGSLWYSPLLFEFAASQAGDSGVKLLLVSLVLGVWR